MGSSGLARIVVLLVTVAGVWTAVADAGTAAPGDSSRGALSQPGALAATSVAPATDARRRRRRPGCSRFCRQAGGFGGGAESKPPVRIRKQRLRVASDGIIAVRATCRLSKKCVGAIIVDGFSASYGRADLRIPAHATRRVLVAVPAKGRRYLKRHGVDRTGFATVPLIYKDAPVSVSSTLTILPPR